MNAERVSAESPRAGHFTVKQAAERAGVSSRTIHRWLESGRIKAVRYSNRTIWIPVAEIEKAPT